MVWHESEPSQQTLSDAQMPLTIPHSISCDSNKSLSLFSVYSKLLGNTEVVVHSFRTRTMTSKSLDSGRDGNRNMYC